MEGFRYEALDVTGRTVSGVVQADTARQARAQLRAQGLFPSAVKPAQLRNRVHQPWARGLSSSELSLVTRQLATLLGSGLTMEQSLSALIEEASEPVTRDVLGGVKAEVIAGLSLARSLGHYEKSFPAFYQALVNGGEESGSLPTVLLHLADYLDARQALRQKTSLALLYPALVTVVAIMIVAGLLIYVVPQVVQVFQQSRQTLPLLTRALIVISDILQHAWPYLLLTTIGLVLTARYAMRQDHLRRRWHQALLQLPWLGSLIRSVNSARFASTLAILLGGGVPLLAALKSAAQAMGNMIMGEGVAGAMERVREGASLSQSLGETGQFPPLLIHLVASGEISGKLEQMLQRAAHLETQKTERRLAVFLTLIEPVMILLMGGVVLLIVLAILLPIIEINQLVR